MPSIKNENFKYEKFQHKHKKVNSKCHYENIYAYVEFMIN